MKAVKVYTKSREWQLAEGENDYWFYRKWVETRYGPWWGKWELLGLLEKARICEDSVLTGFVDSWEIKVKHIYAYFRTDVFKMVNIKKQYKNKFRLPNFPQ